MSRCVTPRSALGLVLAGVFCLLALGSWRSSAAAESPTSPIHLDQAWSDTDWSWFYSTPQGSQMIEYSWFKALEQPDSTVPFREALVTQYGYLPNALSGANPDGLPVGFVIDHYGDKRRLGMTCAACHTNRIISGDATLQIDGAPTNADLYGFLRGLGVALNSTLADPGKFNRFAGRVLKGTPHPITPAQLRVQVQQFATNWAGFIQDSTPSTQWGPARADAFGMIFNRVSSIDLHVHTNSHPPNAPVSYPFLWDTSLHDKVQWDGSAPNVLAVERLGRNVGEVLGVFGEIELQKPSLLHHYYRSSVNRLNLLALEERLSHLRSPRWNEKYLGSFNKDLLDRGETVYKTYCAGCHEVVDRDLPNRRLQVVMTPITALGTDPAMASAGLKADRSSGVLQGVRQGILVGDPLRAQETPTNLVTNAIVGAILEPLLPVPGSGAGGNEGGAVGLFNGEREQVKEGLFLLGRTDPLHVVDQDLKNAISDGMKDLAAGRSQKQLAYKARPLDGIWATAPYLHNGSVPNLYQLLLPEAQRMSTFHVGSRRFDAKNVGFDTTEGAFEFDTSLPGNSNHGHSGKLTVGGKTFDYGTDMSEADRWALVEYLKTL